MPGGYVRLWSARYQWSGARILYSRATKTDALQAKVLSDDELSELLGHKE
jgi:hypothetical protein